MALRHSDRHFDPHGHRYGPRRDELHGGCVVTANYGKHAAAAHGQAQEESTFLYHPTNNIA